MATKATDWNQAIFSFLYQKLLDVKFLFREFFLMSHAYDVIGKRFKEDVEKSQKMLIFKTDDFFLILKVGQLFQWNLWLRYFLFFNKTLSEGQEIVHMIKSAENGNLETRTWKSFISLLCIFIFRFHTPLFFPFFRFRVTWPGNRVRKNLPVDLEIRILNFDR